MIDNRRCIGCHACTVACKAEHRDPIGVNKTWVSYVEKGVYPSVSREFHVLRCNHCAEAPCVEICPTACLIERPDGIVDFEPARCIGCKACMQACPYDAITIQPDLGTATKCNYCSHRVDVGRLPACVVVCPAEAIIAGDLADPRSRIAGLVTREDVVTRKPEKGTVPKLYYIDGDASALSPSASSRPRQTLWGWKPDDGVITPGPDSQRGEPRRTYDIAQRQSGSWGWKVSAYLFTKSIAAGLFLVPALLVPFHGFIEYRFQAVAPKLLESDLFGLGVPLAVVALALTGVLLVADLKRPERFHWVLLRPQWRSWLVRGAYVISLYGTLLVVWWGLSPAPGPLRSTLILLGGVLAAATAVYSAWLFGQAKGRDLWQSPLVAVHLLAQALVAGSATFLVIAPVRFEALTPFLMASLLANGLLVLLEIWGKHATADASTAARLMRTGSRGTLLAVGVLAVGHLIPLSLSLLGGVFTLAVAGVFSLIGVALYEHLWVDTPQRLPLA